MAAHSMHLAALWKGAAEAVEGSDLYSLLKDGDFKAGNLATNWTVSAVTAGTATAATDEVLDGLYACKIVDDGDGVNVSQTITIDTALVEAKRCIFALWAKLPTTTSATLKLAFLDSGDAELSSATRTISADADFYDDAEWAYWSKYADAPIGTKKVKAEFYSDTAITWYVDNCRCEFIEQVEGAFAMDWNREKAVIECTTFKSAQEDGNGRRFVVGRETADLNAQTYYEANETYSLDGEEVFFQVFHDTGTALDREEGWGILHSKSYSADNEDAEKKTFSIRPTSRIGETREA